MKLNFVADVRRKGVKESFVSKLKQGVVGRVSGGRG